MTDGSYKKKKFEHRLVQRKDHMKIGRRNKWHEQKSEITSTENVTIFD